MRILSAALCWICVASIALAEDPPTEPVSGKIFQIEAIEDKFTAEVSIAEAKVAKAEAELAKAKQNAGAVRLKSYKSRLVDLTKTGNNAQAAAVKARIEWLEESPEIPSMPALNQLPPGAAVYQYFPEEERPYLIKAYVMRLSAEARVVDYLTKQLGTAKGAAAMEDAQQQFDKSKARYEHDKLTNEPPYIGQDINYWGQSKRGGTLPLAKPVEWKMGMVGTGHGDGYLVTEVISKDRAIIKRLVGKGTQTLMTQGFDTAEMKAGKNVLSSNKVWVSGTAFHQGSDGKQIEVLVVEPFDWDRYKEEQEKLMNK